MLVYSMKAGEWRRAGECRGSYLTSGKVPFEKTLLIVSLWHRFSALLDLHQETGFTALYDRECQLRFLGSISKQE